MEIPSPQQLASVAFPSPEFLKTLRLEKYKMDFKKERYFDLEDLFAADHDELKNMERWMKKVEWRKFTTALEQKRPAQLTLRERARLAGSIGVRSPSKTPLSPEAVLEMEKSRRERQNKLWSEQQAIEKQENLLLSENQTLLEIPVVEYCQRRNRVYEIAIEPDATGLAAWYTTEGVNINGSFLKPVDLSSSKSTMQFTLG